MSLYVLRISNLSETEVQLIFGLDDTAPVETTLVTTAVTTVDSFNTTDIFQLDYLTQYLNFKEHIMIRKTASNTPVHNAIATATMDAESGVETVAAIVVASGFASSLAGLSFLVA